MSPAAAPRRPARPSPGAAADDHGRSLGAQRVARTGRGQHLVPVAGHDQPGLVKEQLLRVVLALAPGLGALGEQHQPPLGPRGGDIENSPFLGPFSLLWRAGIAQPIDKPLGQAHPLAAARGFGEAVARVDAGHEDDIKLQPLGPVGGEQLHRVGDGALALLVALDEVLAQRAEVSLAVVEVVVVAPERRQVAGCVEPVLDAAHEADDADEILDAPCPLAPAEQIGVGQLAAGRDRPDDIRGVGVLGHVEELRAEGEEPPHAGVVGGEAQEEGGVIAHGSESRATMGGCATIARDRHPLHLRKLPLPRRELNAPHAERRAEEHPPHRPACRRVDQELDPREQVLHALVLGHAAGPAALGGDVLEVERRGDAVELGVGPRDHREAREGLGRPAGDLPTHHRRDRVARVVVAGELDDLHRGALGQRLSR